MKAILESWSLSFGVLEETKLTKPQIPKIDNF